LKKQVDKGHYQFSKYIDKQRWASFWHQLDEVLAFSPDRVLEIGPGPGLFKAAACALGMHVETLDLDPELKPDYIASVLDLPFDDGAFNIVCAFQMLEHLPYETAMQALKEMIRVARQGLVLSLPDAKRSWPYSIYIPRFGSKSFYIERPTLTAKEHVFDGQHYWEVNKKGYSLPKIIRDMESTQGISLKKTYRVHEFPYHRFFVLDKTGNGSPDAEHRAL
jgi:predicted SAM-dependent methyltransferase